MIVKITSKKQVTLPAHVLDAMGVGPGDQLEITESPEGYLLKPKGIDYSRPGKPKSIDYSRLGLLKDLIPPDAPPFDIREFRDGTYDPTLRD